MALSAALEIGDQTLAGFDQLVGLDTEHVVPGAGGGPHLIVLTRLPHPSFTLAA